MTIKTYAQFIKENLTGEGYPEVSKIITKSTSLDDFCENFCTALNNFEATKPEYILSKIQEYFPDIESDENWKDTILSNSDLVNELQVMLDG